MIPKIATPDIPFKFESHTIVQILKHAVTKKCISFNTHEFDQDKSIIYTVIVKFDSGEVTAEYDTVLTKYISGKLVTDFNTHNFSITCSPLWLQIMRILMHIPNSTKKSISRALKLFPEKLLLIIHLLISTQHIFPIHLLLQTHELIPQHDISSSLLRTFFDNVGHTYTIYTYIVTNNEPKNVLCYSKFCGYEHNPYNISKKLIQFFDDIHSLKNDDFNCHTIQKLGLFQPSGIIDPVSNIYLICTWHIKSIIVGQIYDSKISMLTYQIVTDIPYYYGYDMITEYMKNTRKHHNDFRELVTKINGHVPDDIQIHHLMIDDKLC